MHLPIDIPRDQLNEFCRRNHIRRLAFFGSVVRDDFGPESDIDVLVGFEPGHVPGLIRFCGMEIELGELLGGRRVDLNTPECLSPYFRESVLGEARVQFPAIEGLKTRDCLVGNPEDLVHLDWSSEWLP